MMNAPVLDLRDGDLLWQHLGHAANLLGHIDTLLDCPELGDHLGHVLAHPDRLQVALLLGLTYHHSLHLVVTLGHLLKWHIFRFFLDRSAHTSLCPHPRGAHKVSFTFAHSVLGLCFSTLAVDRLHFCTGNSSHSSFCSKPGKHIHSKIKNRRILLNLLYPDTQSCRPLSQ